jgi:hypothetical protein
MTTICYRYPQMRLCGCTIPCRTAITEVRMDHVIDNLYIGPMQAAYVLENLQQNNITHVVNASNLQYIQYSDHISYFTISVEGKYFIFSQFKDPKSHKLRVVFLKV